MTRVVVDLAVVKKEGAPERMLEYLTEQMNKNGWVSVVLDTYIVDPFLPEGRSEVRSCAKIYAEEYKQWLYIYPHEYTILPEEIVEYEDML